MPPPTILDKVMQRIFLDTSDENSFRFEGFKWFSDVIPYPKVQLMEKSTGNKGIFSISPKVSENLTDPREAETIRCRNYCPSVAAMNIQEVVIPCGDSNYNALGYARNLLSVQPNAFRVPSCPDLFALHLGPIENLHSNGVVEKIYIRVLPVERFCVVFRVADLDPVTEHLQTEKNMEWSMLGHRAGLSDEHLPKQIQLTSPHLCGVDIRFTDSDKPLSYFNEGVAAVLQHTLPEVQSARVLGGDAKVQEHKFGHAGDCWSEVRAITKRKLASPSMLPRNAAGNALLNHKLNISALPSTKE